LKERAAVSNTFYLTIIVLTFVSPLIVPLGVTIHHAVTEAVRGWQKRAAAAASTVVGAWRPAVTPSLAGASA
jgi:hypothetical protein